MKHFHQRANDFRSLQSMLKQFIRVPIPRRVSELDTHKIHKYYLPEKISAELMGNVKVYFVLKSIDILR